MATRNYKRTTTEYVTRITGSSISELRDNLGAVSGSGTRWETDGEALLLIETGTVEEG